jgi:hypothetical protein
MNDQHHKQIPTVIADAPGEPAHGGYLAPPQLLSGDSPTTGRSIALLLLIGTLIFHGSFVADPLLSLAGRLGDWQPRLIAGLAILVIQILAIFRSHRWPTFTLWLALFIVTAGIVLVQR